MRLVKIAMCVCVTALLAAAAAAADVQADGQAVGIVVVGDGPGGRAVEIGQARIIVEAEAEAPPAEAAPAEAAPAEPPVKPQPRAIRAAPALKAVKRIQVAPAQVQPAQPVPAAVKEVRPAEAPEQAVPARPVQAKAVALTPAGVVQAWSAPRTMVLAYLGVSTSSPNETLRSQLGLPAGTGLVVDYVDAKGPAAAAGVQVHDVVTKLDDQILVNPPQLAVLVRLRKADEKVALTFIRGGKEQKASATLVEKEQTVHADGTPMPWPGAGLSVSARSIEDVMRDVPAAAGAIRAGTVATAFNAVMADGEHTLQITTKDGERHLKATDAQGNVVFEGPIETDAQRAAVPDAIRAKLDRMEPKVEIQMEGGPGQGGIRIQAVPLPQRIQRFMPVQPAWPAEEAPKEGETPAGEAPEKPADATGKAAEARVQTPVQVQGGGIATSQVRMKDDEHDICITVSEKGVHLVAKDAQGNVLYDGPINSDEDLAKVPPAVREKLEGIQVHAAVSSD